MDIDGLLLPRALAVLLTDAVKAIRNHPSLRLDKKVVSHNGLQDSIKLLSNTSLYNMRRLVEKLPCGTFGRWKKEPPA